MAIRGPANSTRTATIATVVPIATAAAVTEVTSVNHAPRPVAGRTRRPTPTAHTGASARETQTAATRDADTMTPPPWAPISASAAASIPRTMTTATTPAVPARG